jgi:hypothetical protein
MGALSIKTTDTRKTINAAELVFPPSVRIHIEIQKRGYN